MNEDERKESTPPARTTDERPSALGKYAHLLESSDDFAMRKQAEIDHEDRGWNPDTPSLKT